MLEAAPKASIDGKLLALAIGSLLSDLPLQPRGGGRREVQIMNPEQSNSLLSIDIQIRIRARAYRIQVKDAKDLLARSKIISEAVGAGRVKLVVGLYNLDTGATEFEQ